MATYRTKQFLVTDKKIPAKLATRIKTQILAAIHLTLAIEGIKLEDSNASTELIEVIGAGCEGLYIEQLQQTKLKLERD